MVLAYLLYFAIVVFVIVKVSVPTYRTFSVHDETDLDSYLSFFSTVVCSFSFGIFWPFTLVNYIIYKLFFVGKTVKQS